MSNSCNILLQKAMKTLHKLQLLSIFEDRCFFSQIMTYSLDYFYIYLLHTPWGAEVAQWLECRTYD